MVLLSKCSELNKGAFSTFVLYRPVTGRSDMECICSKFGQYLVFGVDEIWMPFNIAHLGKNGCVMATFIR